MGRPRSPDLSDSNRLHLSEFLAGHLSAGQLSERLHYVDGHSGRRPEEGRGNRPHTHRRVVGVAVGGILAAIAVAAIALGIGSHPRVVAAHRANTGQTEASHGQASARVVSDQRATSPSPQASSLNGSERSTPVSPSVVPMHKDKSSARKSRRFLGSSPKRARNTTGTSAVATPQQTGAGGTAPAGTTPSGTPPGGTNAGGTAPTGTTPTGTASGGPARTGTRPTGTTPRATAPIGR